MLLIAPILQPSLLNNILLIKQKDSQIEQEKEKLKSQFTGPITFTQKTLSKSKNNESLLSNPLDYHGLRLL